MSRIYIYKRYPPEFKAKAINLRRQGYSLYELRDLLKVRLATAQGWVRNVPLSIQAKKRIHQRILDGGRIARARAAVVNRHRVEIWKQGIREESGNVIRKMEWTPELGKLLCGVLYLCEGSKYPVGRQLGFGNSDPRIINAFLKLLRENFVIDERKFRCQIWHRCDQSLRDLTCYWSEVTSIPVEQFYSSKPDERTRGKPTLRKDYRGVCYIQYLSTTLQYTLQSLGDMLMELHGRENGGAGEGRTLTFGMPCRRAPATLRPHV